MLDNNFMNISRCFFPIKTSLMFVHLTCSFERLLKESKSYKNSRVTRSHNAHHKVANCWNVWMLCVVNQKDYRKVFLLFSTHALGYCCCDRFVWLWKDLNVLLIASHVAQWMKADSSISRSYSNLLFSVGYWLIRLTLQSQKLLNYSALNTIINHYQSPAAALRISELNLTNRLAFHLLVRLNKQREKWKSNEEKSQQN